MFNTIALTIEIYLFFLLMGWGATRLILPDSTRPYQFWIVPWFGLIVADISVVWFSRLGLATNQSVHLVTLLGIGLLALCRFRKVPLSVPLQRFDAIIAFGSLIALFLALYPLLAVSPEPTTISLGNNDPPLYAIVADFLKSHTIKQPPQINPEYPSTLLIVDSLTPGNRTGSWLVFGLLASRFNLATYKILTLTLGIFFALTPPLITIFTLVVTKRHFAAMIALTLSILNVNLLYFNYHGFAAHILAQGCFILAFLWLYLAERGDEPFEYYLLPLGLTISSLFTLFPEMGAFFIVPLAFYVVLKLIEKKDQKFNIIRRFALVPAVTLLIDPYGFWHGIKYLLIASGQDANLRMPRWPFPVDMVGFISIHSAKNYPYLLLILTSLLVVGILALGLYRLDNKKLGFSILAFALVILVWLGVVRVFSYGYYKAIGFFIFALIIAFSVGLASLVTWLSTRFSVSFLQFFTLCLVGLFSAMASLPMFQLMAVPPLRVTPELANLSEVPIIAKDRKLYLDTREVWGQLWATNFLDESRIAFINIDPYNPNIKPSSVVEKGGVLITVNNIDGFIINTDKLFWNNASYVAAIREESKINVRIGKNWWKLDDWWLDKSDSKAFHWVNQDATLEIENKWTQPIQAAFNFKFIQILPKTTVDVYLNNNIIETIKLKNKASFYPVSGKLKPGDNQLRFHVREGVIQPSGDTRQIALGVNAIRFAIER